MPTDICHNHPLSATVPQGTCGKAINQSLEMSSKPRFSGPSRPFRVASPQLLGEQNPFSASYRLSDTKGLPFL